MAIIARNKKLLSYLITTFCAVLLSYFLSRLTGVTEIENRIWDWRVKFSASYNKPDPRIKVIEVDQRSLEEQAAAGYTWPWPRSRYAKIIEFMELAGAKGLAFDVLFTERSSYGLSDDQELAKASAKGLPVLHIAALSNNLRDFDESLFEIFAEKLDIQNKKSGYSNWYVSNLPLNGKRDEFESVILPVKELLESVKSFGNVKSDPDSDGVMRYYTIGGEVRGLPLLNSPFAFYDLVAGDLNEKIRLIDFADEKGRLTVRFKKSGAANPYPGFSADAIIKSIDQIKAGQEPQVNPAEFSGDWIYFGLTAPGLYDLKPTPLEKQGKAVMFLANVLDNLLNNDFIIKIRDSYNVIISALLSLLISGIVFYNTRISSQVFWTLFIFILFLFLQFYVSVIGYWASFTMPFTAALFSLMVSLTLQFYLEGRQHRFIRNAFRHYVSPSLIEEIVKNPETLSLGGEKKELSVFFSDIAGFTSISEQLEVTKLVNLMNSFLTEMTGIVQSNQGTVDKYIGDAVVAFWNAPLDVKDHAYLSVKTALDCQLKLKELNNYYKKNFDVEVKLRVGINTASVSVGNFGSRERFSYTVIGDGVNLASRLEGVNKVFQTYILITDATKQALAGRIKTRKIGKIKVIGRNESITVHEPVVEGGIDDKTLSTYENALFAFENKDFQQALTLFKSIPTDPVSRAYIIRLESEINKEEDKNWSPVWELTTK